MSELLQTTPRVVIRYWVRYWVAIVVVRCRAVIRLRHGLYRL